MSFSQAVVQLCPDQHRDIANAIAEAMGHGPNNLAVPLQDGEGNRWWGCHAWWKPEVLDAQMAIDLAQVPGLSEIPGATEALAAVITERLGVGEDCCHSWEQCLANHGLSMEVAP